MLVLGSSAPPERGSPADVRPGRQTLEGGFAGAESIDQLLLPWDVNQRA